MQHIPLKIHYLSLPQFSSMDNYILNASNDLEEKVIREVLYQYLGRKSIQEDFKRVTRIVELGNDRSYYKIAIDNLIVGVVRRIWDGPRLTMTFSPE